mmetsp:Transcript_22466/g.63215  ORF Transcript_22466/g.63215 Transcript_22466/m.63215 type:complete len:253 (-) Transcript_22466:259-1017(-)
MQTTEASTWQVSLLRPGVALARTDEGEGLCLGLVVRSEARTTLLKLEHVLLAFQLLTRHRAHHVLEDTTLKQRLQDHDARGLDNHGLLVCDGVLGHRTAEDPAASAPIVHPLVRYLKLDRHKVLGSQLLARHRALGHSVDLFQLRGGGAGCAAGSPERLFAHLSLVNHQKLALPELLLLWPVVKADGSSPSQGLFVPVILRHEALICSSEVLKFLELAILLIGLSLSRFSRLLLLILLRFGVELNLLPEQRL